VEKKDTPEGTSEFDLISLHPQAKIIPESTGANTPLFHHRMSDTFV
jgi:hypothetical protein